MKIVIFNDWGYRNHMPFKEKQGNNSLGLLAMKLIRRIPVLKVRWEKEEAFQKYFKAFYRNAHAKTYPNMYTPLVKQYVWSYAVYIAVIVGYNLDDLENDWKICLGGNDGSK